MTIPGLRLESFEFQVLGSRVTRIRSRALVIGSQRRTTVNWLIGGPLSWCFPSTKILSMTPMTDQTVIGHRRTVPSKPADGKPADGLKSVTRQRCPHSFKIILFCDGLFRNRRMRKRFDPFYRRSILQPRYDFSFP